MNMKLERNTHSKALGYLLWIFGFTGAHRFYFGKPATGTLWFFTGGFFLIGWIIDIFLIPSMDRKADLKYVPGQLNYSVAWLLQVFLGIFGAHRFYMRKWLTGILWLISGGFFLIGYLYDMWTLNGQVSEYNQSHPEVTVG